jgi:ABC-type lipoprotein export system ATPase subunit/predicted  nucleic acid-binding Zn-ribbon protein
MKIQHIELTGMTGFYSGMSLDTVCLDFTHQRNRLILIIGGNQVGKSTLLQHLHPFAAPLSAGENRRSFLNRNYTGQHRKALVISNGVDVYEIEHLYYLDAPTRSYIRRNNVELNPGGGSVTFENILHGELGLTREYLRLGRIGSGIRNLIQDTASERKHFINRILPTVDEWLAYHKNVAEHCRNVKARLNVLGDMLSRIDNVENLQNAEKVALGRVEELDTRYDDVVGNIAVYTDKLNTYTRVLDSPDVEQALAEIDRLQLSAKRIRDDIHAAAVSCTVDEHTLQQSIHELQKQLESLYNQRVQHNTVSVESRNTLLSVENDIAAIQTNVVDVASLQLQVDSLHNECVVGWTEYRNYAAQAPNLKFLDNWPVATERLLNDLYQACVDYRMSSAGVDVLYPGTSDSELQKSYAFGAALLSRLRQVIEKISNGVVDRNLVDLRPSDCVIHTCPYFVNAKHNDENRKILHELQQSYTEWTEYVSTLGAVAEARTAARALHSRVKTIVDKYRIDMKYLRALGLEYVVTVDNPYVLAPTLAVVDMPFLIDCMQRTLALQRCIEVYRGVYARYSTLVDNLQCMTTIKNNADSQLSTLKKRARELEARIRDSQQHIAAIDNKYADIDRCLQDKQTQLAECRRLSQLQTQLAATENALQTATSRCSEYQSMRDKQTDARVKLHELNSLLADINAQRSEVDRELQTLRRQLSDRAQYTREVEECTAMQVDLERIRRTLDPTRGIPVYFANAYLQSIEQPINELLQISCRHADREFQLKFMVDDQQFSILMGSPGDDVANMVDIANGSGAEQAIASLALAFGLLRALQTRFKVVCIDELDGVFDANYRRSFITALQYQIQALGCEQVFIITHNREFDDVDVDTILMKNHNADANPRHHVLWRYDADAV